MEYGIVAILIAESLSQNNNAASGCGISKSLKSCLSHISSHVVEAIALYSASAEDLEMVACFLDFHEIKESPRNMQNPVTDFLCPNTLPNQHHKKLSALNCCWQIKRYLDLESVLDT